MTSRSSRARSAAVAAARGRRRRSMVIGAGVAAVVVVVLVLLALRPETPDNQTLLNAHDHGIATEVVVQGRVTQLLPDSTGPSGTHERFDVDVSGLVVEIDHNLALAPRVPVTAGDTVTIKGQFEPDPGHPVIHDTHHQVDRHPGGWIELNGQTYS